MSKEPNESRLQEIKDNLAIEQGFKNFNELKVIYTIDLIIKFMEEVCKRYAFECSKEKDSLIIELSNALKSIRGIGDKERTDKI